MIGRFNRGSILCDGYLERIKMGRESNPNSCMNTVIREIGNGLDMKAILVKYPTFKRTSVQTYFYDELLRRREKGLL